MRRDQDLTITKNNSQTDIVVVQDGETADDWLDLSQVTATEVVYQIAEGTTSTNFDETDVVFEAPTDQISVVEWGTTDAIWPERLSDPEDGLGVAEPPAGTLVIFVEINASDTKELLVSPVNNGERDAELVRECKITGAGDLGDSRRAISVVQGNVTVLPSTDDGTTV